MIVRVSDTLSGVDARAVSVNFGDGTRASAKKVFRHRYTHAGLYTIVVHVRDTSATQASSVAW